MAAYKDDYVHFSCIVDRKTHETLDRVIGRGMKAKFGTALLQKAADSLRVHGAGWAVKLGKDEYYLELMEDET